MICVIKYPDSMNSTFYIQVYTKLPETAVNGHDLLSRLHCVRSEEGAVGLPQATMSRMMV